MSHDVGTTPPVRRVAVRPIAPPAGPAASPPTGTPTSSSLLERLRLLHPGLLSAAAGVTLAAVLVAGWQLLDRPDGPSPVEPITAAAGDAVRLEDPGAEVVDAGVVRWEDGSATALVLVAVDDARTSFLVTLRESDGRWRSTGIERAR